VSVVYAIQLTMLAVVAAAAIFRSGTLQRRPGDRAVRALFLAALSFEIALALGFPAIYWFVFRLLGEVPGLPQLIQHAASMAMAYQLEIFTLCITSPNDHEGALRGLRLRRRWLAAALAALVVCYLLGPFRLGLAMLGTTGHRDAGVVAYIVVIQLYVGRAVLSMLRLSWRNRNVDGTFLRIGLRLMFVGCGCGLLFSLHKISYFAAAALGARLPWDEHGTSGIQLVFLGPAVAGLSAGVLLPLLGPRIALRWRRRRAYRRLRPLASALSRLTPQGPGAGALRGPHARLLGRVIGIRDALIGPLHQRLDAGVYARALGLARRGGLPADHAEAVAEAACIAAAVHALDGDPAATPDPPRLRLGADLDAEASWLAKVSSAYATSPVVHAVLRDAEGTVR